MHNYTYMKREVNDIKIEAEKRGFKITDKKDLTYFGILFALEDLNINLTS